MVFLLGLLTRASWMIARYAVGTTLATTACRMLVEGVTAGCGCEAPTVVKDRTTVYVSGQLVPTQGAGCGIYWGPGDEKNVAKCLTGVYTNLAVAITAATLVMKQAVSAGISRICIVTDCEELVEYATGKRDLQQLEDGRFRGLIMKVLHMLNNAKLDVIWRRGEGHLSNEDEKEAYRLSKQGANLLLERNINLN
ncbi:unnamed protein product [Dicrocoelium dendriticum]|nr:unnamed protein product [Dicrocoelium dendriticum]